MTANQQSFLRNIMEVRFYVWELHLYLDTHPCDETALQLLEKYQKKNEELTSKYEYQYGPLSSSSGNGAEWTKAPWPWQRAGDC